MFARFFDSNKKISIEALKRTENEVGRLFNERKSKKYFQIMTNLKLKNIS